MGVTPQQRREREAAFRAVALDALDVGKGAPQVRQAADDDIDDAVAAAQVNVERHRAARREGRPVRPLSEADLRHVRHEIRAERRGEAPAEAAETTTDPRRERLGEWLGSLTMEQRDALIGSDALNDLTPAEETFVFKRLAELEVAELGVEGAELKAALEQEETARRNIDTLAESEEWAREQEDADVFGEGLAAMLAGGSDAASAEWGEQNAAYGLTDDEVIAAGESIADLGTTDWEGDE